jgi:hypothetical protein
MPLGSFRINRMARAIQAFFAQFGFARVLDNPNPFSTSSLDRFSWSVSTSDSYTIVGATGEDTATGSDSGVAYIYSNATGALLHTLHNPNSASTPTSDRFGYTVGISNSHAIVGAPYEESGGTAGNDSGVAYIFSTTTGQLLHTLQNPNAYGTAAGDNFGWSVAISGSYAIVGAPGEDDPTGSQVGRAYIFSTSTGALLWSLSNFNASGSTELDQFGWSVGISNSHAIVGAIYESYGGIEAGAAYIYSTTTGALLHVLLNPNSAGTAEYDWFGTSVGISDTHAIVGAPNKSDDANGWNSSGEAYIYSTTTGALLHTLQNPNPFGTPNADNFGYTVGISNTHAIVGAFGEDELNNNNSGKAYIYSNTTGQLLNTLDNPNAYFTAAADNFGWSVAISNSYAVVGAVDEDDAGGNTSGKAYLYSGNPAEHMPLPAPLGILRQAVGTAAANTIVIPAAAGVGDIAVLFDFSTSTTDITPAGWTSIVKSSTSGIRVNVSYRILTAGDLGTTVTGLAGIARKVMQVFRAVNNPNPVVTFSTPTQEATAAPPPDQTIPAGAPGAQSVYLGVYGKTLSTTPTRGFEQTGFTSLENSSVSTSGVYVKYTIRQAGANTITQAPVKLTMTDAGTNTLQGFRMDIS